MKLDPFRFPQIPRFFSAAILFLALWAGFGFLLGINSLGLKPNSSTNEEVLGITASESGHLRDTLTYWLSIAEKNPDYRDAFIMAASAAYQLGNNNQTSDLLHLAHALDPTFPVILEMQKLLEE